MRNNERQRNLSWQDEDAMCKARSLWANETWVKYVKLALTRICFRNVELIEDMYSEFAILRLPHFCDMYIPGIGGSLEQYTCDQIKRYALKEMMVRRDHPTVHLSVLCIDFPQASESELLELQKFKDLCTADELNVWAAKQSGQTWDMIIKRFGHSRKRTYELYHNVQELIIEWRKRNE